MSGDVNDGLDQFYVAAESRGTGLATGLLAEAERALLTGGAELGWLACAIGNDRAARFYEKHGWRRAGEMVHHPETSEDPIRLRVWRFEKLLSPAQG